MCFSVAPWGMVAAGGGLCHSSWANFGCYWLLFYAAKWLKATATFFHLSESQSPRSTCKDSYSMRTLSGADGSLHRMHSYAVLSRTISKSGDDRSKARLFISL